MNREGHNGYRGHKGTALCVYNQASACQMTIPVATTTKILDYDERQFQVGMMREFRHTNEALQGRTFVSFVPFVSIVSSVLRSNTPGRSL